MGFMERWQEFLSGLFGDKAATDKSSITVTLINEWNIETKSPKQWQIEPMLSKLGTEQLKQELPTKIETTSDEAMSPETQEKYETMLWIMKSHLGVNYGNRNEDPNNIDCSQLVGEGLRKLGLLKPSFQTKAKLANSFFNYYINQWAQAKNPEEIRNGDLVFRYEGEQDADRHPKDIVYHVALATSDAQQKGNDIFISTIESTTDGSFDWVQEFAHRKMQKGRHYAIDREIVYNTVLENVSYAWTEKPFNGNLPT